MSPPILPLPRPRPRLLLAACGIALSACAATQAADTSANPSAETQLQQLVGDAACSSNDQCRTLAWGSKACGGPQRYVAWSTTATDPQALQALASQHAAQQREDNRASGKVSDCSFVADPGAACVAQHCQLATGARSPAAR